MTTETGREITVDEAAAILGASPRTVRRWCKAKKLVGRQVDRGNGRVLPGNEWRIDADSVQALAAELAADASPADTTRKPKRAQAARPLTRVDSRLAADLRAFRAEIADLQAALAALPGEQQKTAEAIQAALEQQTADREKITAALGDLRALVEAQAAEIAGLREELQEARRPWWRRIIGGGGNG
jgi:excisionase family DNA binding protein